MSKLHIRKLDNELEELISFMTNNTWDYHADPKPWKEQIEKAFRNGWYQEDRETFWVEHDKDKIGLIIIHDISNTIPLFDIRFANHARGNGYGKIAVSWIVDYLFNLPDKKIRIEAYTRSDNLAMRKTLSNCGFVKEGYLRQAWENNDGSVSDSVLYGMIRHDWENKAQTPIEIDKLPF